jgi:uncharacterized membrane protein
LIILKRKKVLFLAIVFVISNLIAVASVQARPSYQPQIKPLEGCGACHENQGGAGPMNVFGQDWVNNGKDYKKITDIDSDNDGFTNAEEIATKSFPGDATSTPKRSLPWVAIGIFLVITAVIVLFAVTAIRSKNREPEDSE